MSDVLIHKRGQVWILKDEVRDKSNILGSSVQRGTRPVLIFSSDKGNETNNTVIVLKITSHSEKAPYSVNVGFINENGKPNAILCNQVATVDKSDLVRYCYTVSDEIMSKVEKAHQLATDTVPPDINNKIEEIYKILEDLAVIKSNHMHDTTKDEKMIADVAFELKKLYANMSKYHDSTAEELRNSIPAINDYNAKQRMGVSTNATKSKQASVHSEVNVNSSSDSVKCERASRDRKPSGYWTTERIQQFISDKATLPLDEWMKKYGYTDRKTLMKAYYTYSSKLNRMRS